MKELILTNTNKVIRDAFIEDDAIYFHYKPILNNAKYRDGDPRILAMQPHGSNEVIGDIFKNFVELMEHFDDVLIKVVCDDSDPRFYLIKEINFIYRRYQYIARYKHDVDSFPGPDFPIPLCYLVHAMIYVPNDMVLEREYDRYKVEDGQLEKIGTVDRSIIYLLDALSVEVMYRYYKAMAEHIERNKITKDDYPPPEHPPAINDDAY